MQKILFYFSRSASSINRFVLIKKSDSTKNFLEKKEKKHFAKSFLVCEIFGLECLVDDLTDIFKSIDFCQYLFH